MICYSLIRVIHFVTTGASISNCYFFGILRVLQPWAMHPVNISEYVRNISSFLECAIWKFVKVRWEKNKIGFFSIGELVLEESKGRVDISKSVSIFKIVCA